MIIDFKEKPLLNEPSSTWVGSMSKKGRTELFRPEDYPLIIRWVKKSPECIGIIKGITNDIMESFEFKYVGKVKKDAENSIKSAQDFCKKNFFKQVFKDGLVDWLILGNYAIWLKTYSSEDIKEAERILGKRITKEDLLELKQDETISADNKIKHVPWSTVKPVVDKYQITGYVQKVGGDDDIPFTKREIIHAKWITIDGKAYGHSPVIGAMSSIQALGFIKDYNAGFFENNCIPNNLFIMEEEAPSSPNVKALRAIINEFQPSTQKQKNMVLTGKIKVEPLNQFDKDMEFRQQAIYHTGVIALAFGLPLSRLTPILGSQVRTSAGSEDASVQAYYDTISDAQDYHETLWNTQLFVPEFRCEIRFNRVYRQNWIREAQANTQYGQHANTLLDMYSEGSEEEKEKISRYIQEEVLRIPVEYRAKKLVASKKEGGFGDSFGQGGREQRTDRDVLKGPSQNVADEAKRAEQTGIKSLEYKEKPTFDLDLDTFENEVQTMKQRNRFKKVNFMEDGDNYIFYLTTADEVYRTKIGKSQLSRTRIANLVGRKVKGVVK